MVALRIRENFEQCSLKELVNERNKIITSLKEYEDEFIFNTPPEDVMYPKPCPLTIYKCNNEDLTMITELIQEKIKDCKQ